MSGELFKRNNLMGFILKVSGVVVLAEYSSEYGEIPMVALTAFFIPIIAGLLIIGFGEVIDLLQSLVDKGKPKPEIEKKEHHS